MLNLYNMRKYRKLPSHGQEKVIFSLDFSSNDYLNLSQHEGVKHATIEAVYRYGIGSRASRVVAEYHDIHATLEQQIALDKHTETALICSSGFQINISVLSALLDHTVLKCRPVVFCDRLNHSSLYQALFLSQCEWVRYRHIDMEHLEALLIQYSHDSRPKFIVTETVFGMDGDIAPLSKIHALALHYKLFVYLDEAHATGVLGKTGYGCSTDQNWSAIPHIFMGTFSKALGCSGGYVACAQVMKDYLVNKALGFIYSTGPSPILSAAALEAWKRVKTMEQERRHLRILGNTLRTALRALNYNTQNSETHIVPIILGDESKTLHAQHVLRENGIIVSAIRPPTVPPGSARLRIALRSSHTLEDVSSTVEALGKL